MKGMVWDGIEDDYIDDVIAFVKSMLKGKKTDQFAFGYGICLKMGTLWTIGAFFKRSDREFGCGAASCGPIEDA